MELDHVDAKAQAEYTQANSNMARCYLDLAKQIFDLERVVKEQKASYRIVAGNMKGYSNVVEKQRARIAELETELAKCRLATTEQPR